MRIGSLCTGIAGLELGLRYAGVDTEPVFVSDIDLGANQWLAATMPDVPNLGDFTAYDELPEVDLITAGFPCQPFSTAGKREGLTDERYLFDDIARLTSRMGTRPYLFLENVPGLLTANGGHAMARVVHSLAAIGYSITYGLLPATAVGAPHRRNRWWGLAWHTESHQLATSCQSSGSRRRSQEQARKPDPSADNSKLADADSARRKDERIAVKSEQEFAGFGSDCDVPADTEGTERRGSQQQAVDSAVGLAAESGECDRPLADRFGPYAESVARWERMLGRPAPDPTDDGRLSPAFVEWMMGYPQGWVTDALTTRNPALHALGNAVVPQCAAAAFTQLVNRMQP